MCIFLVRLVREPEPPSRTAAFPLGGAAALALLALLVLGCSPSDDGGEGAPAAAHEVPHRLGAHVQSAGPYVLERGPHGELVVLGGWQDFTSRHSVQRIESVLAAVSDDGGASWSTKLLIDHDHVSSSDGGSAAQRWRVAAGPDGVHFTGAKRWIYTADREWVQRASIFELLTLAGHKEPRSCWKLADFRVDGESREHYLLQRGRSVLWYARVEEGRIRASTRMLHHSSAQKETPWASLILGPGERLRVVYVQKVSPPLTVPAVYRTMLVALGEDGSEGQPIELPVESAARAARGAPLLAPWRIRDLRTLVVGDTAHIAIQADAGAVYGAPEQSDAVIYLHSTPSGWSSPTVVSLTSTKGGNQASYFDWIALLPDVDPKTGARSDAAGYLMVSGRRAGEREVGFARLSSAGASPLVHSRGMSALKGATSPTMNRIIGWPAREILYTYLEGFTHHLVYGHTTRVQKGGWPFDRPALLRAGATTPTRIAAWLSAPAAPATLSPSACTLEPTLAIRALTPAPIGAGVVLETAPQPPGTSYALSCPGLTDAGAHRVGGKVALTSFPDPELNFLTYPLGTALQSPWLLADRHDRVWIAQGDGRVARMGPARLSFRPMPIAAEPPASAPAFQGRSRVEWMGEDPHGRVWLYRNWYEQSRGQIASRAGAKWQTFSPAGLAESDQQLGPPFALAHDGGVWIHTPNYLHRIDRLPLESIDFPRDKYGRLIALAGGLSGSLLALTRLPDETKPPPGGMKVGLYRHDASGWSFVTDRRFKPAGGRSTELEQIAVSDKGTLFATATVWVTGQPLLGGQTVQRLLRRHADAWEDVTRVERRPAPQLEVGPCGFVWAHGLSGLVVADADGFTEVPLLPAGASLPAPTGQLNPRHYRGPFAVTRGGDVLSLVGSGSQGLQTPALLRTLLAAGTRGASCSPGP